MATQKKNLHFPELNFVPKDPFYESAIGKISLWALRIGRYIIIFTEIIVIMSFASRFKLDRDLTDLNSSISQKTAVVQSYADTEKQIRLIQQKSASVGKTLKINDGLLAFNILIDEIPSDVKLSRLGYTSSEIQITGVARSSLSFSLFLQALQSQPLFTQVTIDQLTTGDSRDPGIDFAIRLSLQPTETTPLTPQRPVTPATNNAGGV